MFFIKSYNMSSLLAFSMACLILFPAPLKCANIEVLVHIKDLDNQPVAANKIAIEVEGIHKDFRVNGIGNYALKEEISCDKIDSFEIIINFGKSYLNRNIIINESSDNIKKSIKLFKAQDNNYDYKYLQKGLEYVKNPPYDKALAHYEAAKNKYQLIPLDEYNVFLYYNYAIALTNTYKFDNYDNYNLAISYLEQLIDLYDDDKNKKYFTAQNLRKEKLMKDIEDIKNYKKKIEITNFLNKYQETQEAFKKGNYLETAILAESQLKVCEDNPKLCKSTPLNKDRFRTDAGVSYLKAAEQAEKEHKSRENIVIYLNKAKDSLEEVESLDLKTVKKNLQNINSKLISIR